MTKKKPKRTKVQALFSLSPAAVQELHALREKLGKPLSAVVESRILNHQQFAPDIEAWIKQMSESSGVARETVIERALLEVSRAAGRAQKPK